MDLVESLKKVRMNFDFMVVKFQKYLGSSSHCDDESHAHFLFIRKPKHDSLFVYSTTFKTQLPSSSSSSTPSYTLFMHSEIVTLSRCFQKTHHSTRTR